MTNFYIHFGTDGVNKVYDVSTPMPETGICIPISKEDAPIVRSNRVRNLHYDMNGRIVVRSPALNASKTPQKRPYKWVAAVAGAASLGFALGAWFC